MKFATSSKPPGTVTGAGTSQTDGTKQVQDRTGFLSVYVEAGISSWW